MMSERTDRLCGARRRRRRCGVFLSGVIMLGVALTPTVCTAQNAAGTRPDPMRIDWANIRRYAVADANLPARMRGEKRVVFMGDSITDFWINDDPVYFHTNDFLDRGISGQTTPQMLIRFRPDVLDLKPAAVVILGGTNDIAGNTGPETLGFIEGNLASMAELAKANGVRVVLGSVLPAYDFPWRRGLQPAPQIVALNRWIRDYAHRRHFVYLDYYDAMVDSRGGLRATLTTDGVHPNTAGYAVMEPLALAAVRRALGR